MPDTKNKSTALILGKGLLTAEAVASELRARLTRQIGNNWRYLSHQELIARARAILSEYEPTLAEAFHATDLAAFLAGFDEVAGKLPDFAIDAFGNRMGGPPRPPGSIILPSWYGDDDEPIVEFPLIQKAAEKLAQKNILTRYEFDRASDAAKARAFTVAGDMSEDTLATIRDVLSETVDEGASLEGFRRNLGERIDTSGIGSARLETVFRTNVQAAFHDGFAELSSHPVVAELFPYRQYLAVHDARARHEHLELEHLGIEGTAIYRTSDNAFWDTFLPPWDFNCLLPGTRVQGEFVGGFKSWYDGQIVEIATLRGNRITTTANHPILTDSGLIAARDLNPGQTVLDYFLNGGSLIGSSPSSAFVSDHKQNTPSTVEEVFSSLSIVGAVAGVPCRANDFHGDAKRGNGYVDVVGSVCRLLNNITPKPRLDGRCEGGFRGLNTRELGLLRHRQGAFFFNGSRATDIHGRQSNMSLLASLGRNHSPVSSLNIGQRSHFDSMPLQEFANNRIAATILGRKFAERRAASIPIYNNGRVRKVDGVGVANRRVHGGLATQLDARSQEFFTQPAAAHACDFSKVFQRLSSVVSLDKIVEVRKDASYTGHVYDLQSPTGLMVANGIAIGNCRCGVNLLTIEAAARAGLREASEWLRTGYRPIMFSRLPAIPFRPPAGFGARRAVAA